MGFLAGFFGGVTLTAFALYLPLRAHQHTRARQATLLRQHSYVLNYIVEPPPAELSYRPLREQRAGITETIKDRWNEEVEGAARWVQNVEWMRVREGLEERAGRLWGNVRS